MPLVIAVIAIIAIFVISKESIGKSNNTIANGTRDGRYTNHKKEKELIRRYYEQDMLPISEAVAKAHSDMVRLGFDPCISVNQIVVKESTDTWWRNGGGGRRDDRLEYHRLELVGGEDSELIKTRRKRLKCQHPDYDEDTIDSLVYSNGKEISLHDENMKAISVFSRYKVGTIVTHPSFGSGEIVGYTCDENGDVYGTPLLDRYKIYWYNSGQTSTVSINNNQLRKV